ncbi:hypothetical protein [Marvinbryantia formatexigens]|nr:hypothetical protein [Marvinbryantia formatexigens]
MENLGWTTEQAMTAMGPVQKRVFLSKEFSESLTGRLKLQN